MLKQRPWEPHVGESALWYHRFNTYYMLGGPERSIDKAYQAFQSSRAEFCLTGDGPALR